MAPVILNEAVSTKRIRNRVFDEVATNAKTSKDSAPSTPVNLSLAAPSEVVAISDEAVSWNSIIKRRIPNLIPIADHIGCNLFEDPIEWPNRTNPKVYKRARVAHLILEHVGFEFCIDNSAKNEAPPNIVFDVDAIQMSRSDFGTLDYEESL